MTHHKGANDLDEIFWKDTNSRTTVFATKKGAIIKRLGRGFQEWRMLQVIVLRE
jgi:hypothetical protein